jgi:hypothetical protein
MSRLIAVAKSFPGRAEVQLHLLHLEGARAERSFITP